MGSLHTPTTRTGRHLGGRDRITDEGIEETACVVQWARRVTVNPAILVDVGERHFELGVLPRSSTERSGGVHRRHGATTRVR